MPIVIRTYMHVFVTYHLVWWKDGRRLLAASAVFCGISSLQVVTKRVVCTSFE